MADSSSQNSLGEAKNCMRIESTSSQRYGQSEAHHAASPQRSSSGFTRGASDDRHSAPVVRLKLSPKRWRRTRLMYPIKASWLPEVTECKVTALLNKLTMKRFDPISDQIIEWMNRSENEKDGRTLIQVIRLIFERATDDPVRSEMYACLCRKAKDRINQNIQDDEIRDSEGKPIPGGDLFRKYLLNRCQEDFERGWETKSVANRRPARDESSTTVYQANEESFYAAQTARRRGLGLVQFIGELFKQQMLTERIMHECVKRLLQKNEHRLEEEIESLCVLMTTVGPLLDHPKARAHMEVYFERMKGLVESQNIHSCRVRFMLQDVIELRERNWIPRAHDQVTGLDAVAAPVSGFSISTKFDREIEDDVGAGVALLDAPVQRKKLNLTPRTVKTDKSV
ncbi:hypothetical protein EIP91_003377 [Steccherinum ochraceum]|uniref:MIF4G domain-containing protein n=1 Tax=Steccherinum ochraceum TaxID=92696 RepID=A0A4R0RRA1_9APHY|nr:hypothetical protein EIP91_003377 [Steccherinum ochraceum]